MGDYKKKSSFFFLFFPIQQAQTIAQTVIVIAYMVMIFANSVVLYYVANELYFQVRVVYQFSFKFLYKYGILQSFDIAIAAYESNWMDFDVDTQRTLKFLIMRSQKPLAVKSYRHLLSYVLLLTIIFSSDSGGWHISHELENASVTTKCHLLLLHPSASRLRLRKIRLEG